MKQKLAVAWYLISCRLDGGNYWNTGASLEDFWTEVHRKYLYKLWFYKSTIINMASLSKRSCANTIWTQAIRSFWNRLLYLLFFYFHVTVHRDKFLIIKTTTCTTFSNLFWIKLYMFRTVPLSIIRSFSPYTQQWYMLYRFAGIYHCCLYSEKLLMMDRRTVRKM